MKAEQIEKAIKKLDKKMRGMVQNRENPVKENVKKMTVKEFCELAGIHQNYYQNWRKGARASYEQILKMARGLGL